MTQHTKFQLQKSSNKNQTSHIFIQNVQKYTMFIKKVEKKNFPTKTQNCLEQEWRWRYWIFLGNHY